MFLDDFQKLGDFSLLRRKFKKLYRYLYKDIWRFCILYMHFARIQGKLKKYVSPYEPLIPKIGLVTRFTSIVAIFIFEIKADATGYKTDVQTSLAFLPAYSENSTTWAHTKGVTHPFDGFHFLSGVGARIAIEHDRTCATGSDLRLFDRKLRGFFHNPSVTGVSIDSAWVNRCLRVCPKSWKMTQRCIHHLYLL